MSELWQSNLARCRMQCGLMLPSTYDGRLQARHVIASVAPRKVLRLLRTAPSPSQTALPKGSELSCPAEAGRPLQDCPPSRRARQASPRAPPAGSAAASCWAAAFPKFTLRALGCSDGLCAYVHDVTVPSAFEHTLVLREVIEGTALRNRVEPQPRGHWVWVFASNRIDD